MRKQILKQHLTLLNSIKHLPDKERKIVLRNLPPSVIQSVSESCLNLAASKECAKKLSTSQKQKLRKYKRQIIGLANRRTSLNTKRKHVMYGGFLPMLLSAILPLIFGLIKK
jgi:hypothetical protein